jgi:hypothetical protein
MVKRRLRGKVTRTMRRERMVIRMAQIPGPSFSWAEIKTVIMWTWL